MHTNMPEEDFDCGVDDEDEEETAVMEDTFEERKKERFLHREIVKRRLRQRMLYWF